MSDRDAILEKIKKLLRMKRGGTAGEIDNALAMAAKLARDHEIDLNDVNPDDESKPERITFHEDVLKLRLPSEAKFAAAICVNFFNVQMCFKSPLNRYYIKAKARVTFIGSAWDIEIARYVFVFLQHHFRGCWKSRQNRRLKNRKAFLSGMFLGLGAKLEDARKQEVGTGLIHVDRAIQLRKDYLAKLFPNATDKNLGADDSDAHAAKYAGILEGQKTNIAPAVKNQPVQARAMLPPAAGQLALI